MTRGIIKNGEIFVLIVTRTIQNMMHKRSKLDRFSLNNRLSTAGTYKRSSRHESPDCGVRTITSTL
jgi:hypothetical protein